MPTRWTLALTADRPDAEQPVTPAQLHGLAALLLEGTGADHHAQHKPYTVSPLLATPSPQSGRPGALLRLGWLPDTPRPDLTRLTGRTVRLGSQHFTVTTAHEEFTPYAALSQLPPASRAIIQFRSATYFSRNGRWHPLPDPVLLYGGLIRRWNLFAPETARLTDVEGKELLGAVALSAHEISSLPVDLGSGTRIGFTGTAAFRLLGRYEPHERVPQLFPALSLFAITAGAGAQTTHGLGSVEVDLE
ncbi:CRISPR system precrRNA processing endoribonuclease RAMP protein Cas6 [Streptomyces yerevanensis]|uniref:CRISPR system precrRNA processing endoribonuclease RAMP protein Cas6 n=1 Tax=Streptomyces yerevanensis TaxID=66378 RepID=UPI00068953C5|nr:CRISPR system precrRNA processing endoribonuclease RAMP protein Cas6 [Streptomyces yerevanensis]